MRVKVIYDYAPQNDDEHELKVGMELSVTNPAIFDGWMEGTLNGKKGVFPDNFVEILPEEKQEPPPPARPPSVFSERKIAAEPMDDGGQAEKSSDKNTSMAPVKMSSLQGSGGGAGYISPMGKPRCEAKFAYQAERDDELGFDVGDVIVVESRESPDWWLGSLGDKTGLFPSNFVEMMDDDDDMHIRRPSLGPRVLPAMPVGPVVLRKADISQHASGGRKFSKDGKEPPQAKPQEEMPEWMRKRLAKLGELDPDDSSSANSSPAPSVPPHTPAKPLATSVRASWKPKPKIDESESVASDPARPEPVQPKKWVPKGLPQGAVPLPGVAGRAWRGGVSKTQPTESGGRDGEREREREKERGVDMTAPAATPALESVTKTRVGKLAGTRPPSRFGTAASASNAPERPSQAPKNGSGDDIDVHGEILKLVGEVRELKAMLEESVAAQRRLEERVAALER